MLTLEQKYYLFAAQRLEKYQRFLDDGKKVLGTMDGFHVLCK